MTTIQTVSIKTARRLAITKQRLSGPPPKMVDAAAMLETVRAIGCLQLDPISVVARSHLLVLWSRLGAYDVNTLETLLWKDRALFEYWAHCASIVLTEEYPVYLTMMQTYPDIKSGWGQRASAWIEENAELRDHILHHLQRNGPTPSNKLEDKSQSAWESSGWNSGRNVSRMLHYLWMQGRIMVAGRSGIQKLWDISERVLPDRTPREELSDRERTRFAIQRSLRSLGIARPAHIENNYIRGRYPHSKEVLAELEKAGTVHRVEVGDGGRTLPGPWYVHADDLPLIEALQKGESSPRTTLLSPFDNLICDRKRAEMLFDFNFRIEIYTPRDQRKYGYYVLPILHGDSLIGRIDPVMDRKRKVLTVNAVHLEPDAPEDPVTAAAVAEAISELGSFLGARDIDYGEILPDSWRDALAA